MRNAPGRARGFTASGGGPDQMLVTVGHGTLAAEDFLALLEGASVEELVDVRSHPGSRRVPHFGREAMEAWVPAGGIAYRWAPALGGRRRSRGPSRNVALRNESFRAYADHMDSPEFRQALTVLAAEARERTVAIMCAESVWWRCHRRLIADAAVLLHGADARDLFHDGRLVAHQPAAESRRAEIDGEKVVVYDVGVDRPLFDGEGPDSLHIPDV